MYFLFPDFSADHTETVNNSHEVLIQNPVKIQTQTSRKFRMHFHSLFVHLLMQNLGKLLIL